MITNQPDYAQMIFTWITQDQTRLNALKCLQQIGLRDAYVAAGFVRNLVWDRLHNKLLPTPLNDVDVIYYDANEKNSIQHSAYESSLLGMMPQITWQVRNQARMHLKKGHAQYENTLNAMSFWPEKETAVAIRMANNTDGYECISAFGLDSLFGLKVTYNPKCPLDTFQRRVAQKNWLTTWPKLTIQV